MTHLGLNFQPDLSPDSTLFDDSCSHYDLNFDPVVKHPGRQNDFSRNEYTETTADIYCFGQGFYSNSIDPNMGSELDCLDRPDTFRMSQQVHTLAESPANCEMSTYKAGAYTQRFTSEYDDLTEFKEDCNDKGGEVNHSQNASFGYMMEDFEDYPENSDISPARTKKVHLDSTAKLKEEIASLEAIVIGCNLLSLTDGILLSQSVQEDELIRPKLSKKTQVKQKRSLYDQEKTEQKIRVQNNKKNIPGLIVNRVIKSIELAMRVNETDDHRNRYSYIKVILEHHRLNPHEVITFIQYLKGFDIKMRTWSKIQNEINKNSPKSKNCYYERILLDCIDAFLSTRGEKDFDDWITDPKTRLRESKKVLIEAKQHFRENFKEKIKLSM